jgi:hypothetical protein
MVYKKNFSSLKKSIRIWHRYTYGN